MFLLALKNLQAFPPPITTHRKNLQ